MPARKSTAPKPEKNKSLEQWIWDAACSIRGAKNARKHKDFILQLVFCITSAPGIVLFLRASKPKARQGKVILANVIQILEKENPKNFSSPAGIAP